jgi:hypothetical protein
MSRGEENGHGDDIVGAVHGVQRLASAGASISTSRPNTMLLVCQFAAACTAVASTVAAECIVVERYPFMPLDEPSELRFKSRAKPYPKRAK